MDTKTLIQQYVDALNAGNKSKHTIRSYVKDINKLVKQFGLLSVEQIEALTENDFRDFYNAQGLEPNSLNGLIRNLSAFFTYIGFSEKHAFFNVKFGKTRFTKVTRKKKLILSDDEERAIIMAGSNVQERFMIAMALKTGLRRSEIAGIKLNDIDGCQILITGKGGDEQHTYLNETLCHMLAMYKATRETDSEFLFYGTRGEESVSGAISGETVNNRLKACAKRAGLSPERIAMLTAHRMRGTALTKMYLSKGGIAAQALGRHKSFSTTKIYTGDADDEYVKRLLLDG